MLAIGCAGSGNENNEVSHVETPSQIQESSPQPTLAVYQDLEWKKSFEENMHNIDVVRENIKTSAYNVQASLENGEPSMADFYKNLLTENEQYLVDYTQMAMTENNNYTVSSKCLEAQKEWGLALQDYFNGGKYLILISNEAENNTVNSDDVSKCKSLLGSGENHEKRAVDLVAVAFQGTNNHSTDDYLELAKT